MTLIYLKKKDVWQLAHSYQESSIQSYMCVGKWKYPPRKPWKVMGSICASWGGTALWLWRQWERVHGSLSVSLQLINIQQYCRKPMREKHRQWLSGQPVESACWKGTESLVNVVINLVPETGGLELVGAAHFSPQDAYAHICWYDGSTDGHALKSAVARKLATRTGRRKSPNSERLALTQWRPCWLGRWSHQGAPLHKTQKTSSRELFCAAGS